MNIKTKFTKQIGNQYLFLKNCEQKWLNGEITKKSYINELLYMEI